MRGEALAKLKEAAQHLLGGNWYKALQTLKGLKNKRALALAARAHEVAGMPLAALAYYKASVTGVKPRLFSAYIKAGEVLEKQGFLKEAFEIYDKAVAADPTHGWGYLCRGRVAAQLKWASSKDDLHLAHWLGGYE